MKHLFFVVVFIKGGQELCGCKLFPLNSSVKIQTCKTLDKPVFICNNAQVICYYAPTYGAGRGIAGIMSRGMTSLSSPTVPGECRASDVGQLYSQGIYHCKEWGQ